MATAAEIADLITKGMQGPTGAEDIALHQGTVLSWDPVTGVNSVKVGNTAIPNLKSIQPGIQARYTPGDSVLVVRKQTQYFIMGKVAAPGGAAGSAPVGNTVGTAVDLADTAGAWVDMPGSVGPSVSTYIGSNRAALVLWGFKYDGFQSVAEMGWQVSGANTLAPATFNNTTIVSGFTSSIASTGTVIATPSSNYLMGNTVLLNSGLTTFTAKYRSTIGSPAPSQNRISQRTLTVIPL